MDRLTSAAANGDPGQGAYSETYQYDSATGNLRVKGSMTLDYLDSSHVHAVTNANSNTYSYDANGNQTTRHIASDTFNLIYDAENRLVEVKKNSVTIAQFTFDGDGARVKSVMGSETILFVGSHFEQKGSQATKYYLAGSTRVAMRKYVIPQNMTLEYTMGDHLGSTSITTDANGVKISELRYKAWGETRYSWTNAPVTTPTYELPKYQYTGQYSYDAEFGLKFYNARWYDSAIGRFAQADTVVPGGPQGYDRYAYANNSPVAYTDPTGHSPCFFCMVGLAAVISGANAAINYAISTATSGGKISPRGVAVAFVGGALEGAGKAIQTPMPAYEKTTLAMTTTSETLFEVPGGEQEYWAKRVSPSDAVDIDPLPGDWVKKKGDETIWEEPSVDVPMTDPNRPGLRGRMDTTTLTATITTYDQFGNPVGSTTTTVLTTERQYLEEQNGDGWLPWTPPHQPWDPPIQ